jgi:protocatechuate 3,4-dioxygenase beta subunit
MALPDRPSTLVARPAPVLEGVVRTTRPVAGATVVWLASSPPGGGVAGEVVTETDQNGAYLVPDPATWADRVIVFHADFAPFDSYRPAGPDTGSLVHELDAGTPIRGSFVDARSGQGIGDATIWIDGWPLGRSSSDGRFSIGHAPHRWRTLRASNGLLVGTAEATPGQVVIRAETARAVSGSVRDAMSGDPVPGAVVELRIERSEARASAITDGRGLFWIGHLTAGRYDAIVSHPAYSPAYVGRAGIEGIDLRGTPSMERSFDLDRLTSLKGRVEDASGRPVGGVFVGLVPKEQPVLYAGYQGLGMTEYGRDQYIARSEPDGSFGLAVPNDMLRSGRSIGFAWELRAFKEGYAVGRTILGEDSLANSAGPVVRLPSGIEIRGRVTTPDGQPIAGVAVGVAESSAYSEDWLGRQRPESTRSGPDGLFAIRVRHRRHDLAFHKRGLAPLLIRAMDPRSEASIEAVLGPEAGVAGRVVRPDGSGVPALEVSLVGSAHAVPVQTGADGGFFLDGLRPGTYELSVGSSGAGTLYRGRVDAPASGFTIDLGPTGVVRGRVKDAVSGKPVTRFAVEFRRRTPDAPPSGEEMGRTMTLADGEGAFALAEMPLGELDLTVRADGFLARRVEGVQVPAEPAPPLEVGLEPAAVLRGRILDEAGAPVPDVTVSARRGDDHSGAVSDEVGRYELNGLRPGALVVEFRADGFVSLHRSVEIERNATLDITLSRGLSVTGVVVDAGVGVPNAVVQASGNGPGTHQFTYTDRSGHFTLPGLTPGLYSFAAHTEDRAEASLEDVDVESAGFLRLEIRRPPTGELSGAVVGLTEDEMEAALVEATAEEGGRQSASVDEAGEFHMRMPAGRVRVRARTIDWSGGTRWSRAVDLVLEPEGEAVATVEFGGALTIAGTVTREGAPVANAVVSFSPRDAEETATSPTDSSGRYRVAGLEPGRYDVSVSGGDGASYVTEFLASSDGSFDIDITGAVLRGHVVQDGSGAPLAEVDVSLWLMDERETSAAYSATTGPSGEFALVSLRDGRYRLLATRPGYGQQERELDLARGPATELSIAMRPAQGLGLKVVDAPKGRVLDASIVVRNLTKRIVARGAADEGRDGWVRVALADGSYLVSASADGYATATLPATAPGEVTIELTPGGTLIVESPRSLRGRIRLVRPNGEEYVQCSCNGIADIDLDGRRTRVPNVAPGSYTVEVADESGAAYGTVPVVIREAQVSVVTIE